MIYLIFNNWRKYFISVWVGNYGIVLIWKIRIKINNNGLSMLYKGLKWSNKKIIKLRKIDRFRMLSIILPIWLAKLLSMTIKVKDRLLQALIQELFNRKKNPEYRHHLQKYRLYNNKAQIKCQAPSFLLSHLLLNLHAYLSLQL